MLAAEFRDLMRASPIATMWDEPVVVTEIRSWSPAEAELRWIIRAAEILPAIGADVDDEVSEAIEMLLPQTPPVIGKGYVSPDALRLKLVMEHMERTPRAVTPSRRAVPDAPPESVPDFFPSATPSEVEAAVNQPADDDREDYADCSPLPPIVEIGDEDLVEMGQHGEPE